MKKHLLILTLTGGLAFTSCDLQTAENGVEAPATITSENFLKEATFTQLEKAGEDYLPSKDGNYIQFDIPGVSEITISTIEENSEKIIYRGAGKGMFHFMPPQGSDPVQKFHFLYILDNGEKLVAERDFSFRAVKEIDPAAVVLVTKIWKWMPTEVNMGAVWGNGGYLTGAQDGSTTISGAWWGCGTEDGECPSTFSMESQQAGSHWPEAKSECYSDSYMTFGTDGTLAAYDNEGVKIKEGTFAITDFNKNAITNEERFSRGTLHTSPGAILWPFAINTDGMQIGTFDIGWLDSERMVLVYAPGGTGSWGECTWWSFKGEDYPENVLSSHEWYWRPTNVNGGAVWGNGGYLAGPQGGGSDINGSWWGCGVIDGDCYDTFESQIQHAGASWDEIKGECYSTSRMVFYRNGTLTTFSNEGKIICNGTYDLKDYDNNAITNEDKFSRGTLHTSPGAILWPFAINTGGFRPETFDIGWLDENHMILMYSHYGSTAWSECTWWSFGKQ